MNNMSVQFAFFCKLGENITFNRDFLLSRKVVKNFRAQDVDSRVDQVGWGFASFWFLNEFCFSVFFIGPPLPKGFLGGSSEYLTVSPLLGMRCCFIAAWVW